MSCAQPTISMKRVYFIPGLGADERLYAKVNLSGVEEHYLNWIDPEGCKTLAEYAALYVPMIDTSEPFYLVGTSMGGMMAIELQKLVNPEKIVLISTVKTRAELPVHLRTIARIKLDTIFSGSVIQNLSGLIDAVVPWQTQMQRTLFLDMLHSCTPKFLEFAIHACINWDNEQLPANCVHLHGSRDPLFPSGRAKNAQILTGGNHFMVYEMGDQVSEMIDAALAD